MNFEQSMRNIRRVFRLPVAAIVRRNVRLQDKPDGLSKDWPGNVRTHKVN
jgi:hypothetical protein